MSIDLDAPPVQAGLGSRPSSHKFPQWFHTLPSQTRQNFWREFLALLPLGISGGILGHSYCAFVARKALQMPDHMLALLMSSHMLGLLLAGPLVGLWGPMRKSKALAISALAVSLLLIGLGLMPFQLLSPTQSTLLFLVILFLAHVGVAQITTLRSTLWRSNYPIEHRGKLVIINMLSSTVIGALAIMLFGYAMDQWHLSFRYIYLISGTVGLMGAWLFSRIRIENEVVTPATRNHLWAGLMVLKNNRPFRIFMSWMMLHGFATLTVEIVLVVILADEFQLNWITGGAALASITLVVSGVSGLLWAKYFDRHSIFTMRTVSGMTWALARLILIVALLQQSIALVLISRVVSGIAMGGGQLAWRLGHMEFAPKDQDSLYMGTHVSLTGIRGIIAPFVGIGLYKLIGPIWLLGLTGAAQVIASAGFFLMPRFVMSKIEKKVA